MSFKNGFIGVTVVIVLAMPAIAAAHCDTMDGPVVKAAKAALATGDVTHALIWIQPAAESELREAFARALEVRSLSAAVREVADRYFYETLVRLHRTGEGESFTGIEAAGSDVGPVIPEADRALDSGSIDALARMLTTDTITGLRARFDEARAKRAAMRDGDVASGRAYVQAYVAFMHYAERLHDAATVLPD